MIKPTLNCIKGEECAGKVYTMIFEQGGNVFEVCASAILYKNGVGTLFGQNAAESTENTENTENTDTAE